ncbi:DUF2065 domain-containing protein [Leeia oryzae]|uniref:DUF2065 domain-containing protein n=1 Tax=Leeia oryzae TaxID=356662 RepID=UPI0009FED597
MDSFPWKEAFAFLLICEGILPLCLPKAWRDTFSRLVLLKDGQLRFIGLSSLLAGIILLVI